MKKSLILSNFRIEFRRNNASYKEEKNALRWIQQFMNEFAFIHSSQMRSWHLDFFISNLKKEGATYDELLQARSALRFLYQKILRQPVDQNVTHGLEEFDAGPDSFKITA
jgi:site-specific recombinase XerC